MYEKRKNSLSYWRVFSLVVIVLTVLLLVLFPLFFNSSFGFMDFFSERFFAEREVFFAPGDPCVDLNVGPFGPLPLSVDRIDRGEGIYDYYINDYATLCTQTYLVNDYTSPDNNGVIIINASNIAFDCNNSIITNGTTSHSEWRGIAASNVANITITNCTVNGFGRGVYFFNVTNSSLNDINVLSSGDMGFEINQSTNNYFNNINITGSLGFGIYLFQGSVENIINNSFFDRVAENTIFSIGGSNRTSVLNSVFYNCSYVASGENGVIRALGSRGTFVDNVKIYYGIRGFVNDWQNFPCGGDIIKNFYMVNASNTGIQIRGDCHNVSIDNATILYSSRMGIEIRSANNTVNNSFIAYTTGSGTPYGGITLRSPVANTTGNKIMNSLFLNNSPSGIDIGTNVTNIELFNVHSYNNSEYNLMINPYQQGCDTVVNITDSDFNDSLVSSRDIYIYSQGYVQNITFINTSFFNFTIVQDGIKQVNVWWWVDAVARDSLLIPIQNVNIGARDRNNQLVFFALTGSDGRISRQKVLESLHVGPAASVVSTYYSNYSFNANYPVTGESLTQSWNMSMSRDLTFVFNSGSSYFSINFTNPTPGNGTSQTGTIYVNLSTKNPKEHYSFVDFDNSLVAWLRMDDMLNPTTVRDLSRYGNNGTLMGETVINSSFGRFGNGSWFDGVNDYININDANSLDFGVNDFSIGLWFKGEYYSGEILLSKRYGGASENGYMISEDGHSINFYIGGFDNQRSQVDVLDIFDNNWHYLFFVADRNNNKLFAYKDGVLVGEANSTNTAGINLDNSYDLKIGDLAGGSYTNGSIDEVLIFNRILSAAEVRALYNALAYQYENNFIGLEKGIHNFKGYAVDSNGTMNSTETRYVTIFSYPNISFNFPTPLNGTINTFGYFNINVSIVESNLMDMKFNWNGTNYSLYDDSLILMYNFDNRSSLGENDTFVRDLSRYENNGTVIKNAANTGAQWNSSGKYGGAYDFDGVNDYILIKNISKFSSTSKTVSLWIKRKSYPTFSMKLFSLEAAHFQPYYSNFYLALGNNSNYNSYPYIGYINTAGTLVSWNFYSVDVPADVWTQLVFVFNVNGNTVNTSLYRNGVIAGSNQREDGYDARLENNATIGKWSEHHTPYYYNGSIDELRFWNRSLSSEEIAKAYFMDLYKYNQTQWYLSVNQTKNLTAVLDEGDYFYSASAKNREWHESATDTRYIKIKYWSIADIDNLGYLNIVPGGMLRVNFSVYILAGISSDIGRVNISFSNGIISRSDSSCRYIDVIGENLFNYSCSGDIWYFDSPGEWIISAYLYNSVMSLHDRYNESFVLMSEASIQHAGALNWGAVIGGTNVSVLFLLNNTGNTAFSSFDVNAKNLLRESVGPEFIPASNFYMDDVINTELCFGDRMVHESPVLLNGITLAVGNNSINSFNDASGQRALYACLNVPSDPVNMPQGNYVAAGSNSWELTSLPPYNFLA